MIVTQQYEFMSRKPILIIIEGPDCSGKTSLAKFIANKLNAAYFHSTYTPALSGQAQLDHLEQNLKNAEVCLTTSGLDVVMDRHWPSEHVYGKVLRNDLPKVAWFFSHCTQLRVCYIFCLGEECKARHAENANPSHPYTDLQYNEIYNEYERLADAMLHTNENVWVYSIDIHGKNMLEYVERLLK